MKYIISLIAQIIIGTIVIITFNVNIKDIGIVRYIIGWICMTIPIDMLIMRISKDL